MPDNYSNSDFRTMQEQAIRHAKEMQQRAQPNGQNQQHANKRQPASQKQDRPNIFQTRPQKNESFKNTQNENRKKNSEKNSSDEQKPTKSFFPFDFDADMSLVLPLVLFLGKEGADDMLILALLYIMS